jgi:hypothetical protein
LRLDVLSLVAAINFKIFKIGVAVENFLVAGNAVIFQPLGRAV